MGEWHEFGNPSRASSLVDARPTGVRTAVPNLKVGFVLVPDFTLSALALFIDALRLAGDEGDRSRQIRCTWSVMSNRSEPVRASSGLALAPTSTLLPPQSLDYIVVVGGLLHTKREVNPTVVKYLQSAADAGVTLVGVCTGSFVLARAGLMQGFRCCVSWYHVEDFANEFPDHRPVADRLFVAVTARGSPVPAARASRISLRSSSSAISAAALRRRRCTSSLRHIRGRAARRSRTGRWLKPSGITVSDERSSSWSKTWRGRSESISSRRS